MMAGGNFVNGHSQKGNRKMLLAKWIGCLLLITFVSATIAAQSLRPENDPRATSPVPVPTEVNIKDWHCDSPLFDLSSPTMAYKTLYFSVKCKNPANIKKVLSASTVAFITGTSAMQKISFEEAIKHGLTESTFSSTLPEMCSERIEGKFGAVELKSSGKWEDLPFVREEGGWKLAVGDIFDGSYQLTSKPKCTPPTLLPQPAAPGPIKKARHK